MPDKETTRPHLVARIKRAEAVLVELAEAAAVFEALDPAEQRDRYVRMRKAAHLAEVEAWEEHLAAARTLLALADQAWGGEARTREQLGNLVDRLAGTKPHA